MSTGSSSHHWYILGAGAIGSLWACYLTQAGFAVTLITRQSRPQQPLRLISDDCEQLFEVAAFGLDAVPEPAPTIRHLLVTTKAQHTRAAVAAIKPLLADDAVVLLLQNGMTTEPLAAQLPSQRIITAITSDGAYRSDEHTVVHAGRGDTWIGCEPAFLAELPSAFLQLHPCDDIETRQWLKLAVNCAINGLTVIHHCRNGELLNIADAMQTIAGLCNEIQQLAARLRIDVAHRDLQALVIKTLQDTALNYSSMYQDIAHGRSTEIDFLNGYICALAAANEINCPLNQAIVEQVKAAERAAGNSP